MANDLETKHSINISILREASDAIYAKDLQGRYLLINAAGAEIVGKPIKEIIGKDDNALFCRETAKKMMNADRRIFDTGTPEIYEINFAANGVIRTFLSRKKPFHNGSGQIAGLVGISLDITDRKKAEEKEKYKPEDAFLEAIEGAIGAGIVAYDLSGRIRYVNRAFCAMVGWNNQELIGTSPPFLFWLPEEAGAITNDIKSCNRRGLTKRLEQHLRCRNGKCLSVIVLRSPLTDRNGNLIGTVGLFIDISERKQMEETLYRTNQQLQTLIRTYPLAILLLDAVGRVKMWSPAAERIFGWKEKEVMGRFVPVVPDDQRHDFMKKVNKVIKGKRVMGVEVNGVKKGGAPVELSVWGAPFFDDHGNRQSLLTVADNSDRRKIEENILKIQQLESLGSLAQGLVNDFNNMMTALLGNISLAKLYIYSPKDLRISLDHAEKAVMRAIELSQNLLTLAREESLNRKLTSMGELVKESAGFALRGSTVRCEFTIQRGLWEVKIDERQISHVIHNLVFSAQRSASRSGTLRIKIENVQIEKTNRLRLKQGPYIRISLHDFGIGPANENILKVFDPRFMAQNKRSGLRFATACSIIERHGGIITVEPDSENKIRLFIYLPAIRADSRLRSLP